MWGVGSEGIRMLGLFKVVVTWRARTEVVLYAKDEQTEDRG